MQFIVSMKKRYPNFQMIFQEHAISNIDQDVPLMRTGKEVGAPVPLYSH